MLAHLSFAGPSQTVAGAHLRIQRMRRIHAVVPARHWVYHRHKTLQASRRRPWASGTARGELRPTLANLLPLPARLPSFSKNPLNTCQAAPHGSTTTINRTPIYAQSGNGCYLTDVEGVERVDYLNNMTALIHGHANPTINNAIIDQLQRGTAFSEPAEPELDLARLLVTRVPALEKIRFANSGTEAVMLAVKLARTFTGRSRIAKFEGFYHGYYDYVQVSYSSQPDSWGPADAPHSVASSGGLADSVESDVLTLPYNDREAVTRLLEQHGAEIAALLYDPLCNRSGFPLPQDDFLAFLREITRDYGIVLISDEVISFRVSYQGGAARFGGEPDLTVFGKIIGGGLPIGAVGGSAEIMALLDPTEGPPRARLRRHVQRQPTLRDGRPCRPHPTHTGCVHALGSFGR